MRRFCFIVLRAFTLKMWKLPRLSDLGCFGNCRLVILRFLMQSLESSLNHGFPWCLGLVDVFGKGQSVIDITVSLSFKIGYVTFRCICISNSSLYICSCGRQIYIWSSLHLQQILNKNNRTMINSTQIIMNFA